MTPHWFQLDGNDKDLHLIYGTKENIDKDGASHLHKEKVQYINETWTL